MPDPLGDLLRASDPGTVHPGDPLSERGKKELAHYRALETELAHEENGQGSVTALAPKRRRGAWPFALGGIAAAMLLVVVVVLSTMSPTPVYALTPPMLQITQLAEGEGDVGSETPGHSVSEEDASIASQRLLELAQLRLEHERQGNTLREHSWSLESTYGDGDVFESSVTLPEVRELVFEDDGSVRYRLVAGDPFPGQESGELPAPGTVLAEQTYRPGEYVMDEFGQPPSTPEALGDYLAEMIGERVEESAQALHDVTALLSLFFISDEKEAAMLQYIATFDDLTIIGETVDRLGRDGIVFGATDASEGVFELLLVVSPETGAILATEKIYVGEKLDGLDPPAVVDYSAWEQELVRKVH